MTGSTARRWRVAVLLGLTAGLSLPAAPALAAGTSPALSPAVLERALDPLPDVHGLNVADTRKVLQSWNKGVVIIFQPDLRQLPNGVTESTVVASRASQVTPSPNDLKAAFEPQVVVTLGARMPDLAGLSEPAARAALADRGLTLAADPVRPPADWMVSAQAVPAGEVVEFRSPVGVTFGAPIVVPPPPPPRRLPVSLPVAIAIGAGVLLLLILGTALVVRGVRRGRRARRADDRGQDKDRDRHQRPPELIEVHAFAGQVIGPDVFDLPGAPPVASVPPPREVRS